MLGSTFKVQNVTYNQDYKLWTIKLVLCGENDYEFKDLFLSMKNSINEQPSITSLGLYQQ